MSGARLCYAGVVNPLIGVHVGLGEVGALAFLWVAAEFINPTDERVKRAAKVALAGVALLFLSWLVGGYYYLTVYGTAVKPLIKAGPEPWAHAVMMETKEHVFLFIPFLAMLAWSIVAGAGARAITDRDIRFAVIVLAVLVVLMSFAMAGMGYFISGGFRTALQYKVLAP